MRLICTQVKDLRASLGLTVRDRLTWEGALALEGTDIFHPWSERPNHFIGEGRPRGDYDGLLHHLLEHKSVCSLAKKDSISN